MAGLGIVIPRSGPVVGPIVTPLHAAGADGYSRRFLASKIDAAAGTPVTAWTDTVDPSKAINANASTLVDTSNGRAVRLAPQAVLNLPDIIDSPVTIVAVGVVQEDARPFIRAAGMDVVRQSTNNAVRINGIGTTSGYVELAGASKALSAVIAVLSDTAPVLRWNGTESGAISGTFTPSTAASGQGTNGLLSSSLATLPYDYLEVIVFPRALTATERASVYAAMKAKYPAIP